MVLAVAGCCCSQVAYGQSLFPGAGMSNKEYGNGSSPFSQGRGMDHLVRQIEEAPEPNKPMFSTPEWMKPKKPQTARSTFNSPTNKGRSWPQLPKPAWMGGQKQQPNNAWDSGSQNGFMAGTGKNFDQWRQNTGKSIRTTNDNIRSASNNAWQNMARAFQKPAWMNAGSNESPPAIKPPLRTADNWSDRSIDRQ